MLSADSKRRIPRDWILRPTPTRQTSREPANTTPGFCSERLPFRLRGGCSAHSLLPSIAQGQHQEFRSCWRRARRRFDAHAKEGNSFQGQFARDTDSSLLQGMSRNTNPEYSR